MQTSTPPFRLASRTTHIDNLAGVRCWFVGIGGCGMSGLCRLFADRGALVSGSDQAPTPVTEALEEAGIAVSFEQHAGKLPAGTALVVASAAIPPDHPELLAAQDRNITVLTYAEALGLLMRRRTGIAIAGTHGKSTTASMLGVALAATGLDPSVIVGATCDQLSSAGSAPVGFRVGASAISTGPRAGDPGLMIAEACEYNRSFHNLAPTLAAITSVEADHLDIFGSIDAIVHAFAEFAALLPPKARGGKLLIAHDGAHRREIAAATDAEVRTIGFAPTADYFVSIQPLATARTHNNSPAQSITIAEGRHKLATFTLALPGAHMAIDAAFALVLACWAGADPGDAARALSEFRGLDRRMQLLGEVRAPRSAPADPHVRIYDDYGHHPTEVEATLDALRTAERPQDNNARLICVFQPHQHSRTRFLMDEFARSFAHADAVIVPHIYFVRDSEHEKTRVSASDLVDRLREHGVDAMHLHPFDAIVDHLRDTVRPGDVVVVMGAGPVWQIARDLMRSLDAQAAA